MVELLQSSEELAKGEGMLGQNLGGGEVRSHGRVLIYPVYDLFP